MKTVKILDSHTGGEPTRLVLEGFPDLGTGDMESRRKILSEQYDHFRRATMLERAVMMFWLERYCVSQ